MPVISEKYVAFIFFIALGLVAASLAYSIYQLEIVKVALVNSLENQEKMLENQAIGLNRSQHHVQVSEEILNKSAQLFGDLSSAEVYQKTQLENSRIIMHTLYEIRALLTNNGSITINQLEPVLTN